jgi:hypothetical protein
MKKLSALAAVVLIVASAACRRGVFVSLTGPDELAGALIELDGRPVGRFERIESDPGDKKELNGRIPHGAIAYVRVPKGAHQLRITKPGYKPIVQKLHYEQNAGEDYIRVSDPERGDVGAGGGPRPTSSLAHSR